MLDHQSRGPRPRHPGWHKAIGAGAAIALAGGGAFVAFAADHGEAPLAASEPAADINDFYAWHDPATNKLVTVITVLPFFTGNLSDALDDDVLYTVHIDNTDDDDFKSDHDVYVRFGQDSLGNWGMQVQNLPGANGDVVGPVESIIYVDEGRYVFAGQRDDPFFFDLTGFGQTLSTGTVSFDSTRDDFAGANIFAIVLEMDLTEAKGDGSIIRTWATTGIRD